MDFRFSRLLEETPANCIPEEPTETEIAPINFVFIVILACMSGAFSGLNLGLLGLDVKNLELLTKGPFLDEQEAKDA